MNEEVRRTVPLFNEAQVIGDVVRSAREVFQRGYVDDGSVDDSACRGGASGAVVVRHPVNLGQGALQTGFDYALTDPKMRWVVTFDADGQHQIDDVVAMLDLARAEGLDVVFVALPRRPHRGRVRQEARAADGRGLHEPHHQDPAHRRPQRPAADVRATAVAPLVLQNRMARLRARGPDRGHEGALRRGGAHPLPTTRARRAGRWNAVNILVEYRSSDSAADHLEAGMSIVLIQVLLIAVVVAVAARLFRSGGARSQAVRRLGLLLFAGFAVVSILVPTCGTASPGSSASAAAPTWCSTPGGGLPQLHRDDLPALPRVRVRCTRLARRLALDEAARIPQRVRRTGDGGDVLDEPGGRD